MKLFYFLMKKLYENLLSKYFLIKGLNLEISLILQNKIILNK